MTRIFGGLAAVAALGMLACGGKKNAPAAPPAPAPSPAPAPPPTPPTPPPPQDHAVKPPAPAPVDHPPQLFEPAWKTVGVGQTISFSVAAIDQDLDETAVTVTKMPASAKFDALTQTITWTPTKKDMPEGEFTVGATTGPIEWKDGNVSGKGAVVSNFKIAVVAKKQPAPVAPQQDAPAETLFTIREAARLEQVNKDFPFDVMLAKGAELMRPALGDEAAKKLGAVDKPAVYFKQFLKNLADTHGNPRLDPDDPKFDKAAFGDPKSWRIIAVRPRLDKAFMELRIVYMATKAPEPVFAMFRVRPTIDIPTLPADARAHNNEVFVGIVTKRLFKDGKLDPRWVKDARAHGKAVAGLVHDVLDYAEKDRPTARGAFVALPTEARMGGGSLRNADGTYKSGDGWAWSVQKPMPTSDGTAQAYVNIGIPGFWTDVAAAPSPADATKKIWKPVCAPRFDPDDKSHTAGYEVLCRKALGFVDLPGMKDGKVVTAKLDAVNLFLDHKRGPAIAALALDDGRRDLGEENGMPCSQCHIRNFGVHTYSELGNVDPSAGSGTTSHTIDTLNFQIVPTAQWQAFTLEFMKDQACKASKALPGGGGLECDLK
jgi:hypothetical protein